MNNREKIKELIAELNNASSKYYNGQESPLTDAEFDKKLNELKKLEQKEKIIYSNSPTIHVGSPVLSELKKVQISGKPMLSLDKVHSAKEIINFNSSEDLIASIKCDGLSVRLVYEDTDLVSANTRGNGIEGGDITEHVKHFLNVPLKIAKGGRYVIDGEAVILDKDFEIINKNGEFKNSRNAASGALSLLDVSIVEKRRLSFIAWDVIEGTSTNFYHYNLEEAEELGFKTVPAVALDCTKIEENEINEINKDLLSEAEKYYGIPCDGIVWRINKQSEYDKKGRTEHHFCGAVAWKPSDEEFETELLDIEFTMGRTGVLTPVAVFKPVDDGVSIIERASLHNISVMINILGKRPYKGQKIWVFKANKIIPQLARAEQGTGELIFDPTIATVCPICGESVTIEESDSGVLNMVCGNPSCEGKLVNRIEHYLGIKGLNVKGISKKTLEKLIDWGWINGLRDIYKLNEHQVDWESRPGFGKASVSKILNAIDAEGRHTKLNSFITAIGIPLVGASVAKEICKYYSTWSDFRDAIGGDWTEFEGFGPEISKAINSFDYTEADEIVAGGLAFIQQEVQSEVTPAAAIKDKKFCATGKLQNFTRDSLKADIEAHGGKLVSSVTSATDYLITNTPDSGTSKNKDAQRLGVKIITENEYLQMR